MRAYVVENGKYKLQNMEEKRPVGDQVIVSLKTAGLNHRDLKIKNKFNDGNQAYVLGSDGAGIIEAVGDQTSRFQIGDEVFINPGLNWYQNTEAPPADFEIVGVPYNGTFAEKIVISENFVERKPAHLTWPEAGVFSLSALTGYRALITQGKLKRNETLFIPGVGGGVTSFIIQMAKVIGARVITTSRQPNKLKEAELLGFDRGLLTDDDWVKELEDEQIDMVIDSIGGATFNRSLEVLKKGGRMVTFGSSTNDEVSFNLRKFFYGQYTLLGSTMGSREELHELLDFIDKHQLKPLIDRGFPFEQIYKAFDYLESQQQLGKVYIDFGKDK